MGTIVNRIESLTLELWFETRYSCRNFNFRYKMLVYVLILRQFVARAWIENDSCHESFRFSQTAGIAFFQAYFLIKALRNCFKNSLDVFKFLRPLISTDQNRFRHESFFSLKLWKFCALSHGLPSPAILPIIIDHGNEGRCLTTWFCGKYKYFVIRLYLVVMH